MPKKWRPLNCLLVVLTKLNGKDLAMFLDCFGSEMIIANSALRALLAVYHLISNDRSWNNC